MRVAVVGGTGSFGPALAKRLVRAGHDVVIGSRDAERAARAAAELGVEGRDERRRVHGIELVVLATKAEATLETPAELREAIGTTPVLSVAAELAFTPSGVAPLEATSIAARLQESSTARSSPACTRSPRGTSAPTRPPEEDALVAATTTTRRRSCSSSRSGSRRARDRLRAARERPRARGLTAVIVNVNKRYKAHAGVRVTGVPLSRAVPCHSPPRQRDPARGAPRARARRPRGP